MNNFLLIFVIFFIGFFVGYSCPKQKISKLSKNPDFQTSSPQALPSPTNPVLPQSKVETEKEPPNAINHSTAIPSPLKDFNPKELLAKEKAKAQVHSAEEIPDFLNSAEIKEIDSAATHLKTAQKYDETMDALNGKYTGWLNPLPRERGFRMELEASLIPTDRKLRGNLEIRLSRQGKEFTHMSNSGDIQNLQKIDANSSALFIEVGNYLFQLYFLNHLDSLDGNVYLQKNNQRKKVGTIHLERTN